MDTVQYIGEREPHSHNRGIRDWRNYPASRICDCELCGSTKILFPDPHSSNPRNSVCCFRFQSLGFVLLIIFRFESSVEFILFTSRRLEDGQSQNTWGELIICQISWLVLQYVDVVVIFTSVRLESLLQMGEMKMIFFFFNFNGNDFKHVFFFFGYPLPLFVYYFFLYPWFELNFIRGEVVPLYSSTSNNKTK